MKTNTIHIDKKRQIIEKYNSSFQYYDKRYHEIQSNKFRTFLKEYIFREKIILDAGCGTGLLADFALKCVRTITRLKWNYVGADISRNMLKMFKLKLSYSRISQHIHLIVADLEYLPFRKNIFDEIFSITAFQNLYDFEEGLDNLIRVGKNNIEIVLSILKKKVTIAKFNKLVQYKIENYEIYDVPHLEDFILQGHIFKNEK